MTVKEVRERIDLLSGVYDNAIKLQNCCLNNTNAEDCVKELEEEAQLNMTLRNFATYTAEYIFDEIKRLEKIIDDTVVKIN